MKREHLAEIRKLQWADRLAARFDGIRNAIYANWAQMIEGLVVFNAVLRQDPVGAYPQMDFDSRERYRERVSEIARHSDQSELEVAQTASMNNMAVAARCCPMCSRHS